MLRRLLLVGVATGLLAGISVSDAEAKVWSKVLDCVRTMGFDCGGVADYAKSEEKAYEDGTDNHYRL
jgi:hypothetical protein